jgi:hypothetical protein
MFRRLLYGTVLLMTLMPSDGHIDATYDQKEVQVDVILSTAGAALVVCCTIGCGICLCQQRQKVHRHGDVESQKGTGKRNGTFFLVKG